MQSFFGIIDNIKDGDTCVLGKGREYNFYQEDLIEKEGYFLSNTASFSENPNGRHRVALYLKGKKNVTIDGNGAKIVIHGKGTPVLLDSCENITIKNLTIDYARPTMNEFTVLSDEGNGEYIVEIKKGYSYAVENGELFWISGKSKSGGVYWKHKHIQERVGSGQTVPEKGEMSLFPVFRGEEYPFFPPIEKATEISPNIVKLKLQNPEHYLTVGSIVQNRQFIRDEVGTAFVNCKNITYKDNRIMFMHGLGVLAQFCENVHYDGLDCTPKEGRTAASTADFFHFSGCSGDIIVENCVASGAQDDFVNVHGTHLQIQEIIRDKNQVVLKFMNSESWGFDAFREGDEVDFIKWDTLIPYYTAKVLAVSKIDRETVCLTLSSLPEDVELCHDVLENATATASLTVRNNRFLISHGRGILCTTRKKVVIEGNLFQNISAVPLVVEDDCNFWFESGFTTDVVFRNNVIDHCAYYTYGGEKVRAVVQFTPKVMDKESKTPVHKKLTVENNTFKNGINDYRFYLNYVGEVSVSGNTFDRGYYFENSVVESVKDEGNKVI